MKILVIEDDFDKKFQIKEFVKKCIKSADVVEKESLRSGLREIVSETSYDLIILDMSLPNFDISDEEPGGGTPESFAGRELMSQMKLRNISIPVIVITQYSSFENGRITLDDIRNEFDIEFSEFYKGCIYYNVASESWKKELYNFLNMTYGACS